MNSNAVHLPRARKDREAIRPLGLYLRVGRQQHKDVLDVLAAGERGFMGLIIEAPYTERHWELRAEAAKQGLDVVLDPKTHAKATVGGHSPSLARLPWGADQPHRAEDFAGEAGEAIASTIAEFAVEEGFSQILGPTHLLRDPNDRWMRYDIETMQLMSRKLEGVRPRVALIYPLAMPMQVIRDPVRRRAVIAALSDVDADAIWLRIENFGSDATGNKTAAYIEACQDFNQLGIPLIADHAGGLPGLGLLAFGAIGGIAHGITLNEGSNINHWKRPRAEGGGGALGTRTYIPQLDLMLKRHEAEAFLNSSSRVKTFFVCRNSHCCPRGIRDMLERPAGHFIHQRAEQVSQLGSTPESLRVETYLDQLVRPISDAVTIITSLKSIDNKLKKNCKIGSVA